MDSDLSIKQQMMDQQMKEQLKRVMNLCEIFNLVQVNHKPTSGNIKIHFFKMDMALFTDIQIIKQAYQIVTLW